MFRFFLYVKPWCSVLWVQHSTSIREQDQSPNPNKWYSCCRCFEKRSIRTHCNVWTHACYIWDCSWRTQGYSKFRSVAIGLDVFCRWKEKTESLKSSRIRISIKKKIKVGCAVFGQWEMFQASLLLAQPWSGSWGINKTCQALTLLLSFSLLSIFFNKNWFVNGLRRIFRDKVCQTLFVNLLIETYQSVSRELQ